MSTKDIAPVQMTAHPIVSAIQQVVAAGVTPDKMEVLERMLNLSRQIEQDNARREYHAAFSRMQAELPTIAKNRENSHLRTGYADLAQIVREVTPVLARHGFSVTFDVTFEDKSIVAVCKLAHAGHVECTPMRIPCAAVNKGMNDAQAVGASLTYARRYALCAALNLVIDDDTDARSMGSDVDPDAAANIADRVGRITGNDPQKLKVWKQLAGLSPDEPWGAMGSAKYKVVDAALTAEERRTNAPPCPAEPSAWLSGMESRCAAMGLSPSQTADKLKATYASKGATSHLTLSPDQRAAIWAKAHS